MERTVRGAFSGSRAGIGKPAGAMNDIIEFHAALIPRTIPSHGNPFLRKGISGGFHDGGAGFGTTGTIVQRL